MSLPSLPRVSILAFSSASRADRQRGLDGWLTLQVDEILVLHGVALRRSRDGRPILSFPTRRDSGGRRQPTVRPLDDKARRAIEDRVFAALAEREELIP